MLVRPARTLSTGRGLAQQHRIESSGDVFVAAIFHLRSAVGAVRS